MRTSRFLSLLLLLALLLSACDSLPFLRAPTPTYTRVPTWTRIPSRTPTIALTKTPRPTKTVTPTPTITPTRFKTHTPISIGIQPQPVLTDTTPITATLGVSYQELKRGLEPYGFVFPEGTPLTTTLLYEATYPAVPLDLEMSGSPYNLTEISMDFTLHLNDPERTNLATTMMQRLLNLLQPSWDESHSWLLQSIQEGLTSSDDAYDRTTRRGGMTITLEWDRLTTTVALIIRP